jgi:hypothetical protein
MQYRHSQLWPQPNRKPLGPSLNEVTVADVDGHMAEWSSAGWQLVSATTLGHREGERSYLVHCFYWQYGASPAER